MAARLEQLSEDVIPVACEMKVEGAVAEENKNRIDLAEDERQFLKCLARDFNRPCSEVYKELGLGESAGYRVKQRLLSKRYITQVSTSLGKDGKRAVFLVPNPIVFETLKI